MALDLVDGIPRAAIMAGGCGPYPPPGDPRGLTRKSWDLGMVAALREPNNARGWVYRLAQVAQGGHGVLVPGIPETTATRIYEKWHELSVVPNKIDVPMPVTFTEVRGGGAIELNRGLFYLAIYLVHIGEDFISKPNHDPSVWEREFKILAPGISPTVAQAYLIWPFAVTNGLPFT